MAKATRAEWEHRFLTGLQEEWEVVRWQLPREHASALRIPTFSLTDAETRGDAGTGPRCVICA